MFAVPQEMKPLTVLLVEDHQMVRDGFWFLLAVETGIEDLREASGGKQAVNLIRKLQPAVVVMDIAKLWTNIGSISCATLRRRTYPLRHRRSNR